LNPGGWKVKSSTTVVEVGLHRLRRDVVVWPDGTTADYLVTLRPDVAVVFALTPKRELLLVTQYKHPVRTRTLELPAGTLRPGENPLAAARRELREETGHRSSAWRKIGWMYDDSTRNTNRVHIFMAADALPHGSQELEPGEHAAGLRVRKCRLSEAAELVRSGRIVSQSSVASLLRCLDFLRLKRLV
jgi:8-oxo-dGTP pyrophosphatase MutT (NUDIX family)